MRAILVCALVAGLWTSAFAADVAVKVYVDGKLQEYQPSAMFVLGTTYIPLRQAATSLGLKVEWMAEASTARVCGERGCSLIKKTQGIVLNGSLLLPLRAMAGVLNARIQWDGKNKAVFITKSAAPALQH